MGAIRHLEGVDELLEPLDVWHRKTHRRTWEFMTGLQWPISDCFKIRVMATFYNEVGMRKMGLIGSLRIKQVVRFPSLFLLLIIISPAHACARNAERYGVWHVGISSDLTNMYASTTSKRGDVLGEYCYPKINSCIWLLGIDVSCKNNHTYPVLINSDIGSNETKMQCGGRVDEKLYRYAFTNFNLINKIIDHGSVIGIAMPLRADWFTVVRFELRGATAAITTMQSAIDRMVHSKPKSKGKRNSAEGRIL